MTSFDIVLVVASRRNVVIVIVFVEAGDLPADLAALLTPAGDGSNGNVGGVLSGWVSWFMDGFPPPLDNDANEREEVVEEEEGILFIVERLQFGCRCRRRRFRR